MQLPHIYLEHKYKKPPTPGTCNPGKRATDDHDDHKPHTHATLSVPKARAQVTNLAVDDSRQFRVNLQRLMHEKKHVAQEMHLWILRTERIWRTTRGLQMCTKKPPAWEKNPGFKKKTCARCLPFETTNMIVVTSCPEPLTHSHYARGQCRAWTCSLHTHTWCIHA
jgi:hypothetical protein